MRIIILFRRPNDFSTIILREQIMQVVDYLCLKMYPRVCPFQSAFHLNLCSICRCHIASICVSRYLYLLTVQSPIPVPDHPSAILKSRAWEFIATQPLFFAVILKRTATKKRLTFCPREMEATKKQWLGEMDVLLYFRVAIHLKSKCEEWRQKCEAAIKYRKKMSVSSVTLKERPSASEQRGHSLIVSFLYTFSLLPLLNWGNAVYSMRNTIGGLSFGPPR